MGKTINIHKILKGKLLGKWTLGTLEGRWEDKRVKILQKYIVRITDTQNLLRILSSGNPLY
jgi:hypothetical protein